jgi:hypothetical protein
LSGLILASYNGTERIALSTEACCSALRGFVVRERHPLQNAHQHRRAVSFDTGSLVVISVEDAIADRMGQYASHEASNGEMLGQAVTMLRIATEIDRDYLDKRIRVETLNSYGLEFLEERVG